MEKIGSKKFQKALVGDVFMDTVGTSVRGPNHDNPRVLIFEGWETESTIKFRELGSYATFSVDADDRYGFYPRLDAKQTEKLIKRREELKDEIRRYDCILKPLGIIKEKEDERAFERQGP